MKLAAFATLVVVCLLVGVAFVDWWRAHNIGPVQSGAVLAMEHGCLACHGPAGRPDDPHPGGTGGAPSFGHDDVSDHARDASEIREWILDGKPRRLREEQGEEPPPLMTMPAYRGVLTGNEVGQLVAWIEATSDFGRIPGAPASGRAIASSLGCFGCHGPGGRGDTPNPGSLKGYIPSWSGADYPELVEDEAELREWIRDGSPRRLRANPIAAFFIRRQSIRMPAFGDRVNDDEIRRIAEYIRWLREDSPRLSGTPADRGERRQQEDEDQARERGRGLWSGRTRVSESGAAR